MGGFRFSFTWLRKKRIKFRNFFLIPKESKSNLTISLVAIVNENITNKGKLPTCTSDYIVPF